MGRVFSFANRVRQHSARRLMIDKSGSEVKCTVYTGTYLYRKSSDDEGEMIDVTVG